MITQEAPPELSISPVGFICYKQVAPPELLLLHSLIVIVTEDIAG